MDIPDNKQQGVGQLVIGFPSEFSGNSRIEIALPMGILVEASIQQLYPQLIRVSSSLRSSRVLFSPHLNYSLKIFLGSEKKQNPPFTIPELLFEKEDPEQRVQIALAPRLRPLLAAHVTCC